MKWSSSKISFVHFYLKEGNMGTHIEGTQNLKVGQVNDIFPVDYSGKSIAEMGIDDRYFLLIDHMINKLDNFDIFANELLLNIVKNEREFICRDVKTSIGNLYRSLIELKKRYYKKTHAQTMDVEIEMLRVCFRRFFSRKYISVKTYDHSMDMINELGRFLGHWKTLDETRNKKRAERLASKN